MIGVGSARAIKQNRLDIVHPNAKRRSAPKLTWLAAVLASESRWADALTIVIIAETCRSSRMSTLVISAIYDDCFALTIIQTRERWQDAIERVTLARWTLWWPRYCRRHSHVDIVL